MTRLLILLCCLLFLNVTAFTQVGIGGALSYLTIQAQLNRPMLGLDLRNEADWQRIEEAVKLIYKALNNLIVESPTIKLVLKPTSEPLSVW